MGGSTTLDGSEQRSDSVTTAGTWTSILDLGDVGRVDVAVDVSGAATLTAAFSSTGDFSGEAWEFTVDYDSATESIEQFDPAHQYVRAKVDSNLTDLEIVQRGL